MKRSGILLFAIWLITSFQVFAQFKTTTNWSFDASKTEVQTGDEIELIFKVKIIPDWYLYSSDIDPDVGPMVTEAEYETNDSFEVIGGLIPVDAKEKYDEIWGTDVTYFEGKGEFRQKIRVLKKDLDIRGSLTFQTCTDIDGQCIPGGADFDFNFIKVTGGEDQKAQNDYSDLLEAEGGESLWGFFLAAFLFGLAALLTPCVFL